MPEKLHLLYPKVLSGRFEISSNINSTVEVQPTPLYHPRHIDIEEVRRLVSICLRLEQVSSGQPRSPPQSPHLSHSPMLPRSPVSPMRESSLVHTVPLGAPITPMASRVHRQSFHIDDPPVRRHNLHLGPVIREDMTDEELVLVIESLVTRLENSMSSIVSVCQVVADVQYVRQLGGISNILSLIHQALGDSCHL